MNMKTKVNVLVTYDDYTQDELDCIVKIRSLSDRSKENKLRKDFWGQIINQIKGDKTKLVKLSMRFWDEDKVLYSSRNYIYLMKDFGKLWFHPDQRDEFTESLVKKFQLSSNATPYSEKFEVGDGDGYFPINPLAETQMKVNVSFAQSEKKVSFL
jgi:hypothetical protein